MRFRSARRIVATVAALAVCACSASTAPTSYDGTWVGRISPGGAMSFSVGNSVLIWYSLTLAAPASGCPVGLSGGASAPIRGAGFQMLLSRDIDSLQFEGRFESATTASGTIVFTSVNCPATVSATWTATKS